MFRSSRFFLFFFCLLFAASVVRAESLPIRQLEIITENGKVLLKAELAMTPAARQRGLMHRKQLAPLEGMLFVFNSERLRHFWMKNTSLSLDIVFFDAAGRWLNTAFSTVPFSTDTISSQGPARYVLEVAAGDAARFGIGAGSVLLTRPQPVAD